MTAVMTARPPGMIFNGLTLKPVQKGIESLPQILIF